MENVMFHLQGIGLADGDVKYISNLVSRWVRCCGPEWTVKRFKDLRQLLKARLTGEDIVFPEGIATRKNRGGKVILKDHIFHRLLSLPLNRSNIRLMEGMCRTLTAIQLGKVSRTQRKKLLDAVEGESTAGPGRVQEVASSLTLRPLSQKQMEYICSKEAEAKVLYQFLGTNKSSPVFSGNPCLYRGTENRRSDPKCVSFIDYMRQDRATNEFWRNNPEFVGSRVAGLKTLPHDGTIPSMDLPAGVLQVIQEGGCKARWIANPLLLFQALGETIKVKLNAYTQVKYPESAVQDQEDGQLSVQNWLAEGRRVWCFDATAFTDRLPLELQLQLLRKLVVLGVLSEAEVEIFRIVSGKTWISEHIGRELSWRVGQPLGFGPSFFVANLTHASILDTCDQKRSHAWRVVGDDVVIADETLASAYHKVMTDLGVELNLSKSIISDEYGEFLGKLISPEGIIPSGKARRITDPSQIVNRLEWYGENNLLDAIKRLRKRKKRVWAKLLFYPKELGGGGVRVPGTTYRENLSMLDLDRIQRQLIEKEVKTFTKVLTSAADPVTELTMKYQFFESELGWLQDRESGKTQNECHTIPSELLSSPQEWDETACANLGTFLYLVDHSIYQALRQGDSSTAVYTLVNNHGYTPSAEKPFTYRERPTCFHEEKHDVREKPKHRPIPKVFRNSQKWEVKETWKAPSYLR